MQERCRVCARTLCGSQRRWLFHCGSRVSLQVALGHAVGRELLRDGRSEFVCSKCAFVLERMFLCDTVVRRVVALSLERVHRLLLEKERLRSGVRRAYDCNNLESESGPRSDPRSGPRPRPGPDPRPGPGPRSGPDPHPGPDPRPGPGPRPDPQDCKYLQLLEQDLVLSELESWAESEEDHAPLHRCRGCAALRVPDSDYEAVCGVPRGAGRRSTSCGPDARCSEDQDCSPEPGPGPGPGPGRSGSEEELTGSGDAPEEGTGPGHEVEREVPEALEPLKQKRLRGSRLPIRIRTISEQEVRSQTQEVRSQTQEVRSQTQEVRSQTQEVRSQTQNALWAELEELEDEWNDEYVQCAPFRFQQRVMAQQSEQLVHCESTSELCLQELHDAQNQVQTLQTKIRISEDRNRLLQKRLGEMEVELRVVREEAQNQERNLHNLKDSLSSRELEVTDLLRVVEEQNRALCSSCEQVNTGEAAAVQSELFSIQLALDSAHRALKTRDRTEKDLRVALERAEFDLRGALERGRERLTHNQELNQVLDQTRTRLRDSVEQLKDQQNLVLRLNQDHNRILGDLKEKFSRKEQMVQDLRDLLDSKDQDSEVQNLRRILQEREQDLERVLLDRTRTLAQSQDQELQLQELLKDKHNDVQTQSHVLRQNQETIRSLQVLVRGLNLQVEQLRESLRKSGLKQDLLQSELNRTLSERDSVVRGLEEVLRDRYQEVQDLRSLLSRNPLLPDDVMQQLKLHLQLKDRLLQEVMSQPARQVQDQQDQVQELVRTIDQRDQHIQDSSPHFLELLKEQSDIIKELRFGLNPDRDQNLDQDQVRILKEQFKKTEDHPDQVQQDLEDKNQLVKELVSELQRLRGRVCANCGSDGILNLGLDLEDLEDREDHEAPEDREDHEAPEGPGTGGVGLSVESLENQIWS